MPIRVVRSKWKTVMTKRDSTRESTFHSKARFSSVLLIIRKVWVKSQKEINIRQLGKKTNAARVEDL